MTDHLTPDTICPRRRSLMAAAGALALGGFGAVGLSACSGTGSESDGSSGGATSGDLAALSDVPVGGAVLVDDAGEPVVLTQPESGTVVAYSALCTHEGEELTLSGTVLTCPRHQATFDALTGTVTAGPEGGAASSIEALAEVTVQISGDTVVAG